MSSHADTNTSAGTSSRRDDVAATPRRFVVQRWSFGWVVAERKLRRIAVFQRRRSAEKYRDALNAGTVKP